MLLRLRKKIKTKPSNCISHDTVSYKHVICAWPEDNVDSKVISKNLVMCWILSYRAYASKLNLNLQNVLLYDKMVHSRLGTYPHTIRTWITEPQEDPSWSHLLHHSSNCWSPILMHAVSFFIPLNSFILMKFIPTTNICCCNRSDNR